MVETCDEFCKKVQIHSTEFSRLYNRKRASSLHLLSVKDETLARSFSVQYTQLKSIKISLLSLLCEMFSKETETELSISDKIKTESKLRAKIRCFWKVHKKVIVVAIFVTVFLSASS